MATKQIGRMFMLDKQFCLKFLDKKLVGGRLTFLMATKIEKQMTSDFDDTTRTYRYYDKICLIEQKPIRTGPVLVIDQIRVNQHISVSKILIGGEERYIFSSSLKYAKEIE